MSQEIKERVFMIVSEALGRGRDEITEDTTLEELGADSLDGIEIVMAAEEEFDIEITDEEAEKVTTVKESIALIESKKP